MEEDALCFGAVVLLLVFLWFQRRYDDQTQTSQMQIGRKEKVMSISQKEVVTHLEFLGYEVDTRKDFDDGILVTHGAYFNMFVRFAAGGVMFNAFLTSIPRAKTDQQGYLQLINQLNHAATVGRFYKNNEGDLVMEVFYAGEYKKEKFGLFVELWNYDTRGRLGEMNAGDFLK